MARLPICMTVVGSSTVREGRATVSTDDEGFEFEVEVELRPVAVRYEIRHSPACDGSHHG